MRRLVHRQRKQQHDEGDEDLRDVDVQGRIRLTAETAKIAEKSMLCERSELCG
jgi:hypothetical protein